MLIDRLNFIVQFIKNLLINFTKEVFDEKEFDFIGMYMHIKLK
jgi:hypothetical protein